MATTNKDAIGVQPLSVPDWGLGIITSQPATEIPDNAAQDILNLEHDDNGNLATRCGPTQLFATTFANRITSAHYFTAETGEVGILYTTGAQLRLVETNGTGDTNLTGALTLPNDTFWQWVTFGGLAIGVNKATSGDNPVKVSTGGVAAALGGTPPKAKYIEVWNSRVWVVSATEPNQVWGSKLGDPENWTDTTDAGRVKLDVDPNDGDQITGLFATREALYVFKKKRIYKIIPISAVAAPTLASNLKVDIHAQSVGCVSPYSIKPILDDVVFLSEQGLLSLALVQTAEDFRTEAYSRKIAEITKFPKSTEEIPAFIFDNAAQYWLSVPSTVSTRQVNEAFVLDYLRIDQRDEGGRALVRWTRFDGLAAFTAATSFPGGTGKVYVLGAKNAAGTHQLFTYKPKVTAGPFSDNGVAYAKRLKTKAYTVGMPLLRKWWKKWSAGIGLLSNNAQVAVQYFFDDNLNRGGSYSFNLAGTGQGALWDQALWDVASWDSAVTVPKDIVRRFLSNNSGQKSQDVTFIISNGQNNEGIVIKDFMLFYSPLSERGVSDV